MKIDDFSYAEIRKRLSHQNLTCLELTNIYLKKIKEGNNCNDFISVLDERAFINVEQVDAELKQG